MIRLFAYKFSAVFAIATLALALQVPASGVAAPQSSVKATATFSSIINPARNSVPSPNYDIACWAGGAKGAANTTACHTQELAAINHQHALEKIRPITLPRNYWTLAPALQIFVIINLERVSRGLNPVLGVNTQMSTWALTGARKSSDAPLGAWNLTGGSQLQTYGSVWAGDLNSLDAAFLWMYADGWGASGSSNADCTSARAAGCWGHRQVMLGKFGGSANLVAGVASLPRYLANGALNSDAAAIANYRIRVPSFSYTWGAAVAAGAR